MPTHTLSSLTMACRLLLTFNTQTNCSVDHTTMGHWILLFILAYLIPFASKEFCNFALHEEKLPK